MGRRKASGFASRCPALREIQSRLTLPSRGRATLHRGYLAQFRGDAEATAAFAAQALAENKPEERLLSATAHGFLAVAEWLRGRLTEAERAFVSSVTGWREAGHLTTTAWRWYELVLVRRAQGRLDAAVLTCEQALDSLVTSGRPLPAAGPSHVGLAGIAYQRDELGLALRHATEGIALCRRARGAPAETL